MGERGVYCSREEGGRNGTQGLRVCRWIGGCRPSRSVCVALPVAPSTFVGTVLSHRVCVVQLGPGQLAKGPSRGDGPRSLRALRRMVRVSAQREKSEERRFIDVVLRDQAWRRDLHGARVDEIALLALVRSSRRTGPCSSSLSDRRVPTSSLKNAI